jgi:endonuclease/exonuclease/phosphatase family metal-dependent hydrolase
MLRVMTANLLNGAGSPVVLRELLKRYQPDIMGAQELSTNQAEVVEHHFAYGVVKPRDDNEGNGLMSQHEIFPSVLPLPYRDGLSGTIDFEGKSVDVITMHLANPIDGRWGKFIERRLQLRAIGPRLTLPGRHILMGDMNSTPSWPAYHRIGGSMDYSVAAWATRNKAAPQRTWAYKPNWRTMLRIDHVFTAGLVATDVKVRKVDGSDHRALIVDLELE